MSYDVYLVHASENGVGAGRLADALRSRGLTVWFNSFIVGPSIREQMEAGLKASDFGVVLLSPEFFAKKWTRQELDALFSLESPGEIRILPVWWGVGEADVREHSPMLAMRSAAILRGEDIESVAEALFSSILSLAALQSPSSRLRLQIASGFPWRRGPRIMPKSLVQYDLSFEEHFALTELSVYPKGIQRPTGDVLPLIDLIRAHTLWDGRRVTVIGHQVPNRTQILEEVARDEDLPPDPTRPTGAGVAAYVFQLGSVDFNNGELCYVHCLGPYDRSHPGMGPNAPHPDWLCWVTGLLMAYGQMPNSKDNLVDAMYLAASTVWFMPPVSPDGHIIADS